MPLCGRPISCDLARQEGKLRLFGVASGKFQEIYQLSGCVYFRQAPYAPRVQTLHWAARRSPQSRAVLSASM